MKRIGPLAAVAVLLCAPGCDEPAPPPDEAVPITTWRRECPKEWDWGEVPWIPVREGATDVLQPLVVGLGTLTGPGDIQNVPEFHDCQRFAVRQEGRELRFDSLFAIFAVEQTRKLARFAREGNPQVTLAADMPSVYGEYTGGGQALPAAEIVAWGRYPTLGIEPGFNCLYLFKRPTGPDRWQARMVSFGATEEDCSAPRDTLDLNGAMTLRVDPDMSGAPDQPNQVVDFPKVARWVFDPRVEHYYIGIWCDTGWCGVGVRGNRVSSFAERFDTPSDLPPGLRRVYEVKGWYDEQVLATVRGLSLLPSGILGSVIPHPDLGDYTEDTFQEGRWIPTAEVSLTQLDGLTPCPVDANPYKAKLGLDPTAPGRELNKIFLCRGPWRECRRGEPDPPASLDPCEGDPWWAKIISAQTQDITYRCVKRCDPGVVIPGTARWRWSDDDEGIWMRCVNGCCEIGVVDE